MSNFSEILKELMQERGLSCEKLAKNLGLKSATVSRWTLRDYSLKLKNLVMLADYFNCSIEFLAGRTEKPLSFTPKPRPPFMEQFKYILKTHGVSTYKLDKETPVKHVYLNRWRRGGEPLLNTLIILADYLGCTIDQLVGREN